MILTGLPQRRYSTPTCYLAHYLEALVVKQIYSYKLPKHLVLFLGKKKTHYRRTSQPQSEALLWQ